MKTMRKLVAVAGRDVAMRSASDERIPHLPAGRSQSRLMHIDSDFFLEGEGQTRNAVIEGDGLDREFRII